MRPWSPLPDSITRTRGPTRGAERPSAATERHGRADGGGDGVHRVLLPVGGSDLLAFCTSRCINPSLNLRPPPPLTLPNIHLKMSMTVRHAPHPTGPHLSGQISHKPHGDLAVAGKGS